MGRPCLPHATSYSQEMAYYSFPVLLALEVSSASDFQGDAEPDLQAKQRKSLAIITTLD
jgi:hypothetical protein